MIDKSDIRVLSWDVGIKNLAGCYLDYRYHSKQENDELSTEENEKTKESKINWWNIINLLDEDKPSCCGKIIKKVKGKEKVEIDCERECKFFCKINQEVCSYCAIHKKLYDEKIKELVLPEIVEISSIKDSIDSEKPNICEYVNTRGNKCNKPGKYCKTDGTMFLCSSHKSMYIRDLNNEAKLQKIKKKNAKNTDLDTVKMNMWYKLDKIPNLLEVDEVIIENQPSLRNPKMKSIAETLYNYFLCRGIIDKERTKSNINKIRYISPSNKLKVDEDNTIQVLSGKDNKEKYKLTKSLGIKYTKQLLKDDKENLEHLDKHKKKDDLADAYLQGLYYINVLRKSK